MIGERPIDLYRCTGAPIVDGETVPTWELLSIVASPQPAGRAFDWLPEGERQRVRWTLYTQEALTLGREVDGEMLLADRVVINGEVGEILSVQDWAYQTGGLQHFVSAVGIGSPESPLSVPEVEP